MLSYKVSTPIREILAQNPEYNAPLLNVVERGCHENVRMAGKSVRIKDKASGTYMFSADAWEELRELIKDVKQELDIFLVNTTKFNAEIIKMFPKARIDEYVNYIMERKEYEFQDNPSRDMEVVPLDMDWKSFILEHYKDKEFGTDSYISDRLLYSLGLGVLHKGEKAAFIMQHKDGETGPLVVDTRFRGRGIGTYLLNYFSKFLFERNSIIYGLVLPENMPSNRMTISSGYRRAEQNVIWVYRKERNTGLL